MSMVIRIFIYLVEGMFAIGLIGCVFVLILATIDDIKVLFHRDKPLQPSPAEAAATTISQSTLHPQTLYPQAH
jgi:hypothetical protein